MNLVLLGPPGAGKGTQATALAEHFQLVHISTGDLFRNAIKAQTPLGREAQKYLDKGHYVPDTLTNQMLFAFMKDGVPKKGFLFDGFPRNTDQCKALDTFLRERQSQIDLAPLLQVPENMLVDRLLIRGRKDDSREIIQTRLSVYHAQTQPVLDYYAKQELLEPVDGTGEVAAITERLIRAISRRLLPTSK
jgi:adenylate kinase